MKSFIENWELFILYVNYYKFKQIICPKLTIKSKLSTQKIKIRVPIIQQTRQDAKFEGNDAEIKKSIKLNILLLYNGLQIVMQLQ